MRLPIVIAVLGLPVLGPWTGAARGEDVKILREFPPGFSDENKTTRQALAIKTADEWKKAWQATGRKGLPVPEVDFDKHMVIAAYAGEKTRGGYSLAVNRIEAGADGLTVHALELTPKPGGPGSSSFSYPHVFAVVPKMPGKVSLNATTRPK